MPDRDHENSVRSRFRRRVREPSSAPFALPDLRARRRFDVSSRVGVLVYQGVTTAEMDEPVIRLAAGLDADVIHIGTPGGEPSVVGVEPVRTVHVDATTGDPIASTAQVLGIPGGLGRERIVEDLAVMTWLAHATKIADGVLAVSTGSLILASAGRLEGRAATGHWLARDLLSALVVDVRTERTVHSDEDRIVTASGANSAIDAAVEPAERVRWGPA